MYVSITDYMQSSAAEIFVKSIKDTGFGILKNHPVDFQLVKNVYIEWEDFFNSRSKFDYLHDKEKQDGFFPYLSGKDLKEYYNIFAWGRYPESLSHRTRDLFHQMNSLATTLLNWIELYTPDEIKARFSRPLSEMIQDSPRNLLRILYYPALTGDEAFGAVRAAPHEDLDLLTILPAATTTGLQVKDTQGKWHDIEAGPGTIVVNTGNMLQMCSNGYYRTPTQQVINPVSEERNIPRFSMPLFLYPGDDVCQKQ